jgi:flagellar motor switch protein FliN/FliY
MAEETPNPTPATGEPEKAAAPKPATAAESLAADALKAAQEAIASLGKPGEAPSKGPPAPRSGEAQPFTPPPLAPAAAAGKAEGIDLLADVDLDVKIELGRTRMFVEDVLRLKDGAVVELDKLAGDPVDVYVNDRPVARGEVLILNDNFCVRVNEILAPPGQDG